MFSTIKAGNLLVAHPNLRSGVFTRSVVLITEASEQGHVGVVLNKVSSYNMRQVALSQEIELHTDEMLYTGGPVNKHALIMVHSGEWYSSNTMPVNQDISISSDALMIEKISMGNAPIDFRFCGGTSAWHQGQLEDEIQHHNSWLVIPSNRSLVFDGDGHAQWEQAVATASSLTINEFFT